MAHLSILECPPDIWSRFSLNVHLKVHLLGGSDCDLLELIPIDVRLHCSVKMFMIIILLQGESANIDKCVVDGPKFSLS